MVTGVSGSGKSSLAFDTLYAEGQRRYIESLSAYARQFLERIEKPDVDEITGIAPAISIRQKNSTRNPRSTVATATEIYDYLRLLYARVGHTFCVVCGDEVRKDTFDEIAERVLALPHGRRFYVLYELNFSPESPPGNAAATALAQTEEDRQRKRETIREGLVSLRKRGFNRLFQAGRVFEFSTPEELLDVDFAKPVYVLVDRLGAGPEIRSRLMDSIEICLPRRPRRSDSRIRSENPRERRPSDWFSATASIARNAARNIRNPSRGFFRSIIPMARAPAARASATRWISISIA